MAKQTVKKTALYCRLSKDDERMGESASIETQKTMLAQYAKENNLFPYEFYVDDGYTGLNFDRPAFRRMIDEVALGQIGTVVTKDLSRLGRDHIKTGEYSEIYFPTHKVRYIAINDQYDTENQQSTYYGSLKTAINEFYSRDTSVKIKAAFLARAKDGKYHSTVPPYGYLKDPLDHNHLIPDPETAPYVVKIYDLVMKGWGNHRIRDYLRENKVPIPTWFHHMRGQLDRGRKFSEEGEQYIWRPDSLRNLIRNRVYCGDTVSLKTETIFKTKKHLRKDSSKWIIVENTHEPLVSREIWERANRLASSKKHDYKNTVTGKGNVFAGLLKCSDCGKAMSKRIYGGGSKKMIYVCSSYATYGKYMCTQHKIFEEDLFNAVRDNLKKYTSLARENPDELVSQIVGYQKQYESDRPDKNSDEYKKLQKRLTDLDRAFDTLYEDHLAERISYENFERLSEKYQREQKEVKNRMMKYEVVDKDEVEKKTDAEKVVDLLAQYSDFEELTSDMMYSLLDRIEVCEPVVVDGKVEQTLKLYYRFVGVIEPHEFNATRYYKKSGRITTLTGMRAAREREDNKHRRRVLKVQDGFANSDIE